MADDHDTTSSPHSLGPFLLGDARVDPASLRIERTGSSLRVEAKVMDVLQALARNPGEVVSRQELEQIVWPGRVVTDDALTNAIGKLRRALGDTPRHPRLIETISKRGYRLKVEPQALAEETTDRDGPPAGPLRRWTGMGWIGAGLLLIAAIAALALWLWKSPGAEHHPPLPDEQPLSLAVIPFDVLGGDTSQAYFAEGVSLDLITELSRIPGLLVIAPGTVFGYRETTADDRSIAAELGVRYLIRGAVQRIGEKIRINIRLLQAESGQTLWAERFAGDTGSLFHIQDEVVNGIARGLRIRFDLPGSLTHKSGATDSIAAYDEFLRGRERYGRRTPEDNRAAREHFQRAITLDPGFARAWAGLALAWSRLAIDGWTDDPERALSKAEEYAGRAESIDASVPQIHFVRAHVELFHGQHERAAEAAETALKLDPNYADAYALLAWILHYAGRPDQAKPALAEARLRNPRSSASYREIAGEIAFSTGRFEEAAREFEAALERNPALARARLWLAATLVRLGRQEEAAWEVQELLALAPQFSLSRLLLAFPIKDPQQREALTGALAQLGLPE